MEFQELPLNHIRIKTQSSWQVILQSSGFLPGMFERGGGSKRGGGVGVTPPGEKKSFKILVLKMAYFNWNDSKIWEILNFFLPTRGGGYPPPLWCWSPPPDPPWRKPWSCIILGICFVIFTIYLFIPSNLFKATMFNYCSYLLLNKCHNSLIVLHKVFSFLSPVYHVSSNCSCRYFAGLYSESTCFFL